MSPITFDIILCTYNGEQYLDEQLASIVNQCQLPDKIVWSDDGSSDNTTEIVESFCSENGISLKAIKGPQLGPAANFLQAMRHTSADYAFFCDQDDVWLPNKVELFLAQAKRNSQPHLIFSDCWVWDGHQKRQSFWQAERIEPQHILKPQNIMFRNVVQGASMAINRELITAAQTPQDCMMHDWWLALSANAFGAISIISTPTMLYRQHSNNAVGANKKRSFQVKRKASQGIVQQAGHFYQLHRSTLANRAPNPWRDFYNANNMAKRAYFLAKHRPYRGTKKRTITLWASLLLTK